VTRREALAHPGSWSSAPAQRKRARIYRHLHAGLAESQEIKTLYITPGSPWENGHIESFHDKLRDECLNRELFGNLHEARVILESWRVEYNERRPHSALGYHAEIIFRRVRSAPLAVGRGWLCGLGLGAFD
jgi:transposase InsO family protein